MRAPPSLAGLLLAALCMAASLTPSLIPRTLLLQAVLSGCALASGYGIGALAAWAWRQLGLPLPSSDRRRGWAPWIHGLATLVVAAALLRAPHWQTSVHRAVGLGDVGGGDVLLIGLLALLVFAALVACARLVRVLVLRLTRRFSRRAPPRLARAGAVLAAALLVALVANGLVFRIGLRIVDASFREADALIPPDMPAPREADRTGGPGSLVAWEDLGRMGREFVSATPSAARLAASGMAPTQRPLRVYVGLPAADSARGRAQLALAELQRVGGFSRGTLVVVTPTGTGWVDPASITAIEHLLHGNVASVAVQYSYLSSPLSLLLEPEYGRDSARALFEAVYGYWRTLPKATRPRLYLHGLSLGAMHSERSAALFDVLGDPVQGALWSGPPFASQYWHALTRQRNPGTPAWRPVFRDGAFVRFMDHRGTGVDARAPWGPMRVVYLQYASDAVVFYEHAAFVRAPAWMRAPRGPDVAADMHWYPVVTGLQLTLDMLLANQAPMGHGHVYAPGDYLQAWRALAGSGDWTPAGLDRLRQTLDAERATALDEDAGSG